jgi:uncharacterized protein
VRIELFGIDTVRREKIEVAFQRSVMKIALVLGLAVASLPLTARAAQTIDCKSALSSSESTVCNTPSLLKLDSRMMADLEILRQYYGRSKTSNPTRINNWLHAFAARRDKCGPDGECILHLYEKEITPLDNSVQRIRLVVSPGIQ